MIKLYFYSVMKGEAKGPVSWILQAVLYPFSLLYFGVISLHGFFYDKGHLSSTRIGCKVVSIGNITVGGTGKTPFTIMLFDLIKEMGKRSAVVLRGYGKDEKLLLRGKLKPIPVESGRDRVKVCESLLLDNEIDVILLDDAFQHRRIQRNLDIVLIDSTNPFGNRALLPCGILRESISSLKRADLIILTKTNLVKDTAKMETLIKNVSPAPILRAVHRPISFTCVKDGNEVGMTYFKGKKIIMLSSIADPDGFESLLTKYGADIVLKRIYPDHHQYSEKDVSVLLSFPEPLPIVTTNKDIVKIESLLRLDDEKARFFVLNINIDVIEKKEILLDRLHSILSC